MEDRDFSLAEIVGNSVRRALNNWQISVVFMLVGASLSIPAYVLSRLVRFLPDTWDLGFYIFATLIALGFLGLFIGLINVAFEIHDNAVGSTFKLFTSFHLLPRFLAASVLFYLPVAAVLFLVNWLRVFIRGNLLWYIFGAIPVFFTLVIVFSVLVRFYLYPYYMVEKNAGVFESLEKSFHATRGRGFKMLIVFIVANLVSAIPIIGIMSGRLVWVSVYRKISSGVFVE